MSSRSSSVGVGLISLIGEISAIGWAVKAQPWQELVDIGAIGRVGAGIGLVA